MSYRADLQSQLSMIPSRFHTKEDLEMASQYVMPSDSYEMNYPVTLKNAPTHV